MKKIYKNLFKAGGLLSLMAIGLVIVIIMISNSNPFVPEIVQKKGTYVRLPFLPLGDATPTNDSGVLMAIVCHNTNINWNQSFNATAGELATGDVYEYGDVNETSLGTNVPAGTAFTIAVKVRYNTDYFGTAWRVDYANATFSCLDSDLSPTVSCEDMSKHLIATGDDYMWLWFVYNNSGTGFTIGNGDVIGNTACKINVSGYSY